MINSTALIHAKETITEKLGSIKDLPSELANTIANVYYKDAIFYFDYLDKVRTGPSFITSMKNKTEFVQFNNAMSHSMYAVTAVPEYMSNLRKLKNTNYRLYLYAIELFLDIYKYKINKAHKKSKLIRGVLRWCHTPNEIPNLHTMITD